jgi:hypothetical protein
MQWSKLDSKKPRDLTREDDKLRGPSQKSVESCETRSFVQLRDKLTTRAHMQKGEGSRRPGNRHRAKYMRKRKNMSMCKNKIKWTRFSGSLKCIRNFKASRLKTHTHFPTMCNLITRTSFVPRDQSLPFAHVHLSQVCVFFSFPFLT